MVHEKTAPKGKQPAEPTESEPSNRPMREIRRESVISTDEIEDKRDAASISYHIQNVDQMKY
jgi:hypothetical protein